MKKLLMKYAMLTFPEHLILSFIFNECFVVLFCMYVVKFICYNGTVIKIIQISFLLYFIPF